MVGICRPRGLMESCHPRNPQSVSDRGRCFVPAILSSLETPPGSLTKSNKVTPKWNMDEMDIGPDYYFTSCELHSLTRMASEELGKAALSIRPGFGANLTATPGLMSERGRFYDLHSARRNERLRREIYICI